MFSNTLLQSEPGRYVVVAQSVLPVLLILLSFFFKWGPRSEAGSSVKGRPPAFVFGLMWLIIAIAWFFGLLIASMNFDSTSLIVYAVFSLLAMFGCVFWVWFYTRNNSKGFKMANYILLLNLLWTFIMVVSNLSTTSSLDVYAPMAVAIFSGLLFVWTIVANMFSLLELQNK